MRRRKFLKYSVIAVTGSIAGIGVYETYNIYKHPDYQYLQNHKSLIAELAETIIPATDTPGAKEAKVDDFILYFVSTSVSTSDANTIIDGLKDVGTYCQKNFKTKFESCSREERIKTLNYFEERILFSKSSLPGKVKNRLVGKSFIEIFKELTVVGYCTSQAGATEGLVYEHVPVYYNPCTELQPGQHSWATK